MNREEIEKLIEETARKERSKRKGVSVQKRIFFPKLKSNGGK